MTGKIGKIGLSRRGFMAGAGAGAMVLAGGAPLRAQTFPSRAVHWICYQAAGGSMDVTMRAYQPFLERYGLSTQLDYVQGGSGNIARTELFNAEPDGYTMMLEASPGPVFGEVIAGAAYKALEFEPVFGWSREGWQICTAIDNAEIQSIGDVIEVSRRRPIVAASIGRGSTTHLQLLVMQEALGIDMNIVHFSGTGEAYPQVIGGNVDICCGGPGSASRALDRLRILAVFRDTGEPALPDAPTFASLGHDGIPSINQTWYASTVPGTPADRVARLTEIFAQGYDDPEFAPAQNRAGFHSLVRLMPDEIMAINQEAFDLANTYKDQLSSG